MLHIELLPDARAERAQARLALYEWAGCLLGLVGAAWLALKVPSSGLGFAAFLVSNCFFMVSAIKRESIPLLLVQVGYTITSCYGLWNWMR